jgi:hypothetical protein
VHPAQRACTQHIRLLDFESHGLPKALRHHITLSERHIVHAEASQHAGDSGILGVNAVRVLEEADRACTVKMVLVAAQVSVRGGVCVCVCVCA